MNQGCIQCFGLNYLRQVYLQSKLEDVEESKDNEAEDSESSSEDESY